MVQWCIPIVGWYFLDFALEMGHTLVALPQWLVLALDVVEVLVLVGTLAS